MAIRGDGGHLLKNVTYVLKSTGKSVVNTGKTQGIYLNLNVATLWLERVRGVT